MRAFAEGGEFSVEGGRLSQKEASFRGRRLVFRRRRRAFAEGGWFSAE